MVWQSTSSTNHNNQHFVLVVPGKSSSLPDYQVAAQMAYLSRHPSGGSGTGGHTVAAGRLRHPSANPDVYMHGRDLDNVDGADGKNCLLIES